MNTDRSVRRGSWEPWKLHPRKLPVALYVTVRKNNTSLLRNWVNGGLSGAVRIPNLVLAPLALRVTWCVGTQEDEREIWAFTLHTLCHMLLHMTCYLRHFREHQETKISLPSSYRKTRIALPAMRQQDPHSNHPPGCVNLAGSNSSRTLLHYLHYPTRCSPGRHFPEVTASGMGNVGASPPWKPSVFTERSGRRMCNWPVHL